MPRFCQNCDEELVGAVNRCWKCGRLIDTELLTDKPPVRRPPVQLAVLSDGDSAPPPGALMGLGLVLRIQSSIEQLSAPRRYQFAVASVVCGGLACLVGLINGWAILFGIVAIGFGVLGMGARHRDLATMGLVLAVLAIFLGFGQIGIDLWAKYQSRNWLNDLQGIP